MRVLADEIGDRGSEFFLTVAVLVVASAAILYPFRRLKGGNRATGGGPGGSEKGIVGVLWLLAAISIGIVVATH